MYIIIECDDMKGVLIIEQEGAYLAKFLLDKCCGSNIEKSKVYK